MQTIYRKFGPCRRGDHAHCTGAFINADGECEVCACDCHEPNLFGEPESVQRGLFASRKLG
jgi:hypothetical protein